jgi:hypothetical protein
LTNCSTSCYGFLQQSYQQFYGFLQQAYQQFYGFLQEAFPLDQFVKFLFKPGQINLVDSLVTVAHLPHFGLFFVLAFL